MPQAIDEAGNIWEVDAQGRPVRFVGKQGGQQSAAPTVVAPNAQRAQQQAREQSRQDASLGIQQANSDRSAANEAARIQLQREAASRDWAAKVADMQAKGFMLGPDGQSFVKDPNWTPEPAAGATSDRQDRLTRLGALVAQINRVQQLYDAGPGTTKKLAGLKDYLPTDANARFDTAGAALSQQGLAAFRVPGTGTVSDRDAVMFDRANLPTAGTRDASIEEILGGLRSRVEQEYQGLGLGIPKWEGAPQDQNQPVPGVIPGGAAPGGPGAPPSAGGPGGGLPIPGADGPTGAMGNAAQYSTPADLAAATAVQSAYRGGGSLQAMADAATKAGYPPSMDTLNSWRQAVQYRDQTGKFVGVTPPMSGTRSASQQAVGNIVTSPIGTAVADATNMAGFGALEAILPDQFDTIRELNPISSAIGQVGGAIAGTGGLAKLGTRAIEGASPSLAARVLGGGKGAQFARNALGDTAYGAVYGGVTEGEPLSGAAAAAVGSGLGQLGGSALGKVIGGMDVGAAQKALQARGVPLTTGQLLGGMTKGIEDRLTGIPLIGDMVNARRLEGLRAFDKAAMQEAVDPIGGKASEIGNDGIQALYDQTSKSYDNATAGVNVPIDPQFSADIAAVRGGGGNLPPDYAARLDQALSNRLDPITQGTAITGDQYQQAFRGLKGYRNSAAQAAPGFEGDYRDALTKALDALTGQMQRGGGDQVVQGLRNSDAAYRGVKTIEKAAKKAVNGTTSGEIQVFTPAQLNTAATQTADKFGGPRPFADLGDAGQRVLPSKIPDSGTAGRLATFALPAVLGGSSVGVGAVAGGADGAQTGGLTSLGIAAALLAGGTKTGQKAIQKALTERMDSAEWVGRQVRKRKGLFGTAAVPLLLEGGQ